MTSILRGEIWLADLSPIRGHEQAGRRPVLVISDDLFNEGPAGLVVVLPITTTIRGIPLHVTLQPPEGGLKTTSAVLCEAIRSISKERCLKKWGRVPIETLFQVEDRLKILLGL
ncbi:MAG: type II toxin-antitoxin system PemK/MazF family toxin [Candidatus Omnitrophica bacterium]|nr:type II toxin-antitoxin system PemK/MazF family toxin [Candidatus Omnitrophota bacterium]